MSTHISTCCSGARSFLICLPFSLSRTTTENSHLVYSNNHIITVPRRKEPTRNHAHTSEGETPRGSRSHKQTENQMHSIAFFHWGVFTPPRCCFPASSMLLRLLLLLLPFLLLLLHLFPMGLCGADIFLCLHVTSHTRRPHSRPPFNERSTHPTASPISSFRTGEGGDAVSRCVGGAVGGEKHTRLMSV